ncbi:Mitochondrial protein FMP32 [Rasamsonia emersonii CBS 393.64]|uniref:Mitochondrial protein FMP32 n=1 Tax=Rasamsonia emersonii (strain ATCC 16479 / CBS 393.64 / IMI 116815) TaxID=1408163 RepID=A0A0F4YRD2_RASE3|nr:Mitochondrial protein FMP32 [Rasamsonia emersonii CBS 393.64]KKA20640.1 Mitochondrial protein FMP32 [Rasamsonia emersonii CBS 393.64]
MARSKQVVEAPRFLLPRLTWNGTSPRITLSPIQTGPSTRRQRPQQRFNGLNSRDRQLHTSTISPRPFSLILAASRSAVSISHRPSSTKNPSPDATDRPTNPIRHNGVYVAVFKPARRAFHESAVMARDHHFDTLKFVQRLKKEGFSEEQAVAMMRVLNDVIQESIQNLTRTMVLREDSERTTYTQKVDFAKLRSELLNSDSTEAQLTRSSHERIAADLAKLNSRLRDEIGRTQASVRLDLNLEKGRIREEANSQEMRIKETETRIEQEVAGLRERVEAVKFSTLQWLM